ncbi:S8 family peptidase [Flavobacterium amniphilum]|uniref:S8 family peptidase n=1 Tax=Flavobacterium amniphilum TaxID=1834035 RepID=UPI002029C52A|nr:S8 family peptidase [Flavobacterium amniphilum]MCL9804609.1 S8 family peptidase [Flavobacterium amniphilum]
MNSIKYIILLSIINFSLYSQKTAEEENTLKDWYKKDFEQDKILGISLNKFHDLKKGKTTKAKKIIVAVLDTQIELNHEDLKPVIWVNKKEIPNNGIDDDKNGYVDDINGWDFLGTKKGGYMVYENYEYVRIIREQGNKFQNVKREDVQSAELENYDEYQRAFKLYETKDKFYKNWRKSLVFKLGVYGKVKDTLKYFFPKENYTYKQLDSLYKKYKTNDKTFRQRRDNNDQDLGALIDYMRTSFEVGHTTLEHIQGQKAQLDSVIERNLNIDFKERGEIGDNPNQLEIGYGNNKIGANIPGIQLINEHSTRVAGIIGACGKNKIGISGFSNDIIIMPLHVSSSGDEHDKDIATAIRYAVDNGAKVINMSFGKNFSLHKDWIKEAFKYAESHNVLLVHAVGNDGINIDESPFYPNDYNYDNQEEVSGNFINTGSINSKYGEKMVSPFSNYGKKNVDLFAPGEDIYTTIEESKYDFDSGTSLAAPMVSGTAALIWSYYPNLTVQQVKQIILESGTKIDFEVNVPTLNKKVSFSELSKTGRVLNVFNAMELAEKLSKGKTN